MSHLKKQAGPASVELKTVAEFESFVADRDASIVGKLWIYLAIYPSDACGQFVSKLIPEIHSRKFSLVCSPAGFFADGGSSAQAEFLKSASALRESYRFAHASDEELLKKHDIEGE